MRIAFVGAYGNGKTTLTTELSRRLGLERSHGSAMRDPAGGARKALEETSAPELIQLAVRRFAERAAEEARMERGLVSDGSVLHEWVYSKVRLQAGRHPEPSVTLADAPARDDTSRPYEEVVDQAGLLAQEYARSHYDLIVHCPVEFPLPAGHSPISERFRTLSDELMLRMTGTLGLPVHIVRGSLEERIAQVMALPGVPSLVQA
ncbi:ATP-binding protein [Actinoplanes sp. NPDC049596]|uniref:ATP/GTP-binding protein n=1 Tax=unclassified Actinoplanes TaxID=2626549 RepID=UPI00344A8AF9